MPTVSPHIFRSREQTVDNWRKQLNFDPLPPLLASENKAIQYFARGDLLGEQVGSIHSLWQLPEAQRILKKQLPDGAWPRTGEEKHPAINYRLIETWRQFRYLVEAVWIHPRASSGPKSGRVSILVPDPGGRFPRLLSQPVRDVLYRRNHGASHPGGIC